MATHATLSGPKAHYLFAIAAARVIVHMWKATPPHLHQRVQERVEVEMGSLCRGLFPQGWDEGWWLGKVRKGLKAAQSRTASGNGA